jgi:hypothetical protein
MNSLFYYKETRSSPSAIAGQCAKTLPVSLGNVGIERWASADYSETDYLSVFVKHMAPLR